VSLKDYICVSMEINTRVENREKSLPTEAANETLQVASTFHFCGNDFT